MRTALVNFRGRGRWLHGTILTLYTLLTAIMTWPLAREFTRAIPGDSFDGWQNYWNQWWIKVALVDNLRSPLTTDLLYAPTGVGLYFHTLNPFNGLTTLPVQLSFGLIPAYNTVVLLSWVLGGYGVFLLIRWILGPHSSTLLLFHPFTLSCFCAGLVFTFAPIHMAHLLGHMQVMSLQWMPFYILYLLRGLDAVRNGRSWQRDGLLSGLFLTLTGLCDWYFVLYLFFFTGIALIWVWLGGTTRCRFANGFAEALPRDKESVYPNNPILILGPPIIAGLIFLLLLSPMLVPMIREATQFSFMVRPATDLYILSASLADFLVPNRLHTLFRPASFTWVGNQIAPLSERTIGIGYVPLLLSLVAGVALRGRIGLWLIAAIFFLLMALGPTLHIGNITMDHIPAAATLAEAPTGWSPFAVLNRVIPFMRISRSVSRYALMVQLAIAVMSGVGLAFLAGRRGVGRRGGFTTPPLRHSITPLFVLLLVLAEFWVAPYPMSPPDTPDFYTTLRALPGGGSVLNVPMNFDRPGYLLYQTVHQKPLAVAYISRDDPRTLTERAPVLQHFRHLGPDIVDVDPAVVGMTVLHDLAIDYVILDRYKMPSGLEREYTTALATAIFAGQAPFYEDERLTAFKVLEPVERLPYLVLGPLNWGPLVADDTDGLSRTLLDGPASMAVYGAAAAASLHLTYRTKPDVTLSLHATPDGPALRTLPAAVVGADASIDLRAFVTDSASPINLVLRSSTPQSVQVELLRLQ